jgi:hypothetical protein
MKNIEAPFMKKSFVSKFVIMFPTLVFKSFFVSIMSIVE